MTKQDEKHWLAGYDCAIIDVQMVLKENKKLLSPSAYITLVNKFSEKMVVLNERDDFVEYCLSR